jgi:hypothetical protein
MQVLRIPPYPISISYEVPNAFADYLLVIESSDSVEIEEEVTSNANKKVFYSLDNEYVIYDGSYTLTIYEDESGSRGDIVVQDSLEIYRPYVDPNSLASTATEIAEYKAQEFLARSIIDSVLDEGFYYVAKTIEHVGLGTDYAPINYRAHKVLKVYQDNILWFDSSLATPAIFGVTFKLSDNKTAIIKDLPGEEYNRSEQAPLFLPVGQSDWMGPIGYGSSFDNRSDFTFVLETGYKVVPLDIKEATLMLMEDIRCGKLDYYKRYVTSYNTDQFRLQFDKSILEGTGNLLVDKILSKYISDSRVKIGVL